MASPRTPTVHTPEYAVILRLLREARLAAGVSQGEVASKLGYSRTVISKLERGELRLDLLQLRQICQVLGMPLTLFVERMEGALAAQEPADAGTSTPATDSR